MPIGSTSKGDCIIIDDEEGIVELVQDVIESEGIFRNIVLAKDGPEALRKINNQKFSLIITDLNMPKLDGMKLIETLKVEHKARPEATSNFKTPIIIMSGHIESDAIKRATAYGIKNFLVKPFDADQLMARVKKACKL